MTAAALLIPLTAVLAVGGWLLRRTKPTDLRRIPVLVLVTLSWLLVGLVFARLLSLDPILLGLAWGVSLVLVVVMIAWRRRRHQYGPVRQSFLAALSADEFNRVTRGWE